MLTGKWFQGMENYIDLHCKDAHSFQLCHKLCHFNTVKYSAKHTQVFCNFLKQLFFAKKEAYRSGTVNSKSFVGKVLLRIKWKFELN